MKQLSILVLALVSTTATSMTYAQEDGLPMLNEGTKELALSGTLEFPDFEKIDFDIDASYGYFLKDGWEVGVRALGSDLGGVERVDLSGFTEFNFNRSSNIVPFLGASVGIANFSYDGGSLDADTTLDDDGTATVFEVQAGIKWFIRPYMAISTAIGFNVSSDKIYEADNNLDDNLTRVRLGLRYYF